MVIWKHGMPVELRITKVPNGELGEREPHPSASRALAWIRENYTMAELRMILETYSSLAIDGNGLAEVCAETLRRLLHNKPVSDRYLLGLAWELRDIKEREND